MKLDKLSLPFLGFLQATGLLFYIIPVSIFMFNANEIFGRITTFVGPMAFLLLFVVSAIISGLLVLGRAGMLFWEKRYSQAFTLLGWTLAWAVLYLILAFLMLYIAK